MDNNKAKEKESAFDLRRFIYACMHSWITYVVCIGACVVLACAYILIHKPAYEIDAQIMLPQDTGMGGLKIDMAQSFSFSDMLGASSTTDNEISVIQSHTVFLNTAKQLRLNVGYYEKTNPFKWYPTFTLSPLRLTTLPSIPDTIRTAMVFTIDPAGNDKYDIEVKARKKVIHRFKDMPLPVTLDTEYGPFTIDTTKYFATSEASKFRIRFCSYSAAAEAYTKLVEVFAPNKKTDFIGLSYKTPDPTFGKKLLNVIIDNYNQVGIDQRNEKNKETLDFVNERLASLETEMAASEASMENFKRDNQVTMPEVDAGIILERAARIEVALLQAETEHQIIKNTRDFITNPENKYALIPELPSGSSSAMSSDLDDVSRATSNVISGAIRELNAYNQLILERMKLLASAKSTNASVKMLDDQIDALRVTIIESVDRALQNSNVLLSEIRRQHSLAQARIKSYPALEKQYVGIQRLLVVQEQLYLFLLKQREEASMNIAKAAPMVVVIDEPYTLSKPAGLSAAMALALAVFMGFVIATGWVLLVSMKAMPVTAVDEVTSQAKAPVLGKIAEGSRDFDVRTLRSQVQRVLADCDGRTVTVVSEQPGEGKTHVAIELAQSLARTGSPTLLIDAAFTSPQIANILGVAPDSGLSDALSAPDGADIKAYDVDGSFALDVLTAGNSLASASDLLASPRLQQVLDSLPKDYKYIVIDTSALQCSADAYSLAAHTDLTLYVTKVGVTKTGSLAKAADLCEHGVMPRVAIVVNA